jgi:cell division protease FtsH
VSSLRGALRRRLVRVRPSAVSIGLAASLLLLFALLWISISYLSPNAVGRELSLDAFQRATHVRTAVVLDEDARVVGTLDDGTRFWVAYPRNGTTLSILIASMAQSGARVEVDPQTTKGVVRLMTTALLPLLILANLFALIFVAGRSRGSMGEVTDFSRLRRRRAASRVTFDDVAGVDEARVELEEVIDYLRNPQRYAALRAAPPKGVLLFGPPGCGKTLLAKAVAGEAGVPFFAVSGAEFVESLVGVGAARVRDLFARVRTVAPAIVFIDELDAAGRTRVGGFAGGSEERDQTLNQLLVEIDGFDVSAGIVVIAATNRPDILDPALLRPGRFDRHIIIEKPDAERRAQILELHARERPMAHDADLQAIARQTPGFTGADLANVINEAALLSIRSGASEITRENLNEAVQRVLSGPRRGHVLGDEERRRVAVHEAGHAIAAAHVGRASDVHRVSIVARGRGLGTLTLGMEEAVVQTRSQLEQQLFILLGGWAAEQLEFGEPSTGSEDDLEHATTLARDMIGRFGMSKTLGPTRLVMPSAEAYLHDGHAASSLSPETLAAFDEAVRELIKQTCDSAVAAMRRRRKDLVDLADRVIKAESLEGPELAKVLAKIGRVGSTSPGRR